MSLLRFPDASSPPVQNVLQLLLSFIKNAKKKRCASFCALLLVENQPPQFLCQVVVVFKHAPSVYIVCNVYRMNGRSVSVYTDASASLEYLCTMIQNEYEFC